MAENKTSQPYVLTLDASGELTEAQRMTGKTTHPQDNRIITRPDAPDIGKDPQGFGDWLKEWHRRHNER